MLSIDVDNFEMVEPESHFTGPLRQVVPIPHRLDADFSLGYSKRHCPTTDFVEPKVLSPHKTRTGHIPRRIEVERKKRNFVTVDITLNLQINGVIAHLVSTLNLTRKDSIESMSLSMFYNSDFDSRSVESWTAFANHSQLKGRAMHVRKVRENIIITWRAVNIVGADNGIFDVVYIDEKSNKGHGREHMSEPVAPETEKLERTFICFDAEDPEIYCAHLLDAMKRKTETASSVALNLYVDCMPMDGLKEINSEQISRILESSVNMDILRQNTFLDTSALIQQFNMNHMRTLNQLILSNLLINRVTDLKMVKTASMDPSVFHDPNKTFPPLRNILVPSDHTFAERVNNFKFTSLWNKAEPVSITLQLSAENVIIQTLKFYSVPEKTMRLDEFIQGQQFAAHTMASAVKETWANAISNSVRHHLKDVKKGWFNIEESNLEVYNFSKIRKFMVRINFVAEDTLRDLSCLSASGYCKMIKRFCPESVKVHSNASIDVVGGRFPLFTVDLKFSEALSPEEPARFIYSAPSNVLYDAVMAHFDQSFDMLRGIVKVERKVMKKLFWAYDPIMQVFHEHSNDRVTMI